MNDEIQPFLPPADPAAIALRSIHGLVSLADDGSVQEVQL